MQKDEVSTPAQDLLLQWHRANASFGQYRSTDGNLRPPAAGPPGAECPTQCPAPWLCHRRIRKEGGGHAQLLEVQLTQNIPVTGPSNMVQHLSFNLSDLRAVGCCVGPDWGWTLVFALHHGEHSFTLHGEKAQEYAWAVYRLTLEAYTAALAES